MFVSVRRAFTPCSAKSENASSICRGVARSRKNARPPFRSHAGKQPYTLSMRTPSWNSAGRCSSKRMKNRLSPSPTVKSGSV